MEDFALYLPPSLIPSKRVLLLRYKNRFEALAQSLEMTGISVTSAYPVTWMKKEWSPQEFRQAGDVAGMYVRTFVIFVSDFCVPFFLKVMYVPFEVKFVSSVT